MDERGLAVLKAELREDRRVLKEATTLARDRFGNGSPPELEAAAYQLNRFYNVFEQMGVRIAKVFDNDIGEDYGCHSELLPRLTIEVPGLRPAFLDRAVFEDLYQLRGFRHRVRHAYELTLRKDKLAELLDAAERVSAALPGHCEQFLQTVAQQQGCSLPE